MSAAFFLDCSFMYDLVIFLMDSEFRCDKIGCLSNCRIAAWNVVGGDAVHGALPGLVSPPTRDNLKCNHKIAHLQ